MDPVKGQIIVSLMSRDGKSIVIEISFDILNFVWIFIFTGPSGSGDPLAIVGPGGDILGPTEERETIPSTQASNDQQVKYFRNNYLM